MQVALHFQHGRELVHESEIDRARQNIQDY